MDHINGQFETFKVPVTYVNQHIPQPPYFPKFIHLNDEFGFNTVELAKALTHTTERTINENPLPPPDEPTLSDEQNVKKFWTAMSDHPSMAGHPMTTHPRSPIRPTQYLLLCMQTEL